MFNLYWLAALPRWKKRIISIVTDLIALFTISLIAIWLRLGSVVDVDYALFINACIILPFIALPVFIRLGLYRAVIRYIGHRFSLTVIVAVTLTFLIWSTSILMLDLGYPRSALIIAWLLTVFYITLSRQIVRWYLLNYAGEKDSFDAVLIYGAGEAGRQLMQAYCSVPNKRVVGFIDDDKSLHQQKIGSLKVYSRDKLEGLVSRYSVSEVLLAVPTLSSRDRREIITFLSTYHLKVSTLPTMSEIVDGKVSFSDIREVSIDDLLGRDSVPAKEGLLAQCITNKSVMVSGGGGSIGSELCRQIAKQQPSNLVIYELCEFALYQIHHELESLISDVSPKTQLVPILGDVKDEKRLEVVISKYQIETIYHAAAYKHVPLVEHNIGEGLKNNAIGTFTLARVAAEKHVSNFVLISTDKAVRPTNFMGASKRLAEMALQALQDEYTNTRFVMVRFGNVLGSSGSVIPLFKKQIAKGGPVTVTHKEITRYFMTIPEAVSLVMQAGSMGVGGDVFVLDMGEPVKIADLAQKLITLSGLEVIDSEGHGDIAIEYTGLRPGEKLYEELLIGDNVDGTEHPRIMKAHEHYLSYSELLAQFDVIEKALVDYDYKAVQDALNEMVDGFNHSSGIVDHLSW